MTTGLSLYRTHRSKKGVLSIIGRLRAQGKQKHAFSPNDKEEYTPIPYSRYERKRLSEPAIAYLDAKYHKEAEKRQAAEEWLTMHLAENIRRHAKHQGWKVGVNETSSMVMASIVLHAKIYEELLTDEECAKQASIQRSAYQKNWKPKLLDFEPWVLGWIAEVKFR